MPRSLFTLHPRLAADTLPIGRLSLSSLLLMNDATYPWLILVPERAEVREIHELSAADRALLIEEIAQVSLALTEAPVSGESPDASARIIADKINVAALGNVVPQLHVHVIARSIGDPAWPGPVWGKAPPRAYTTDAADAMIATIAARLDGLVRRNHDGVPR